MILTTPCFSPTTRELGAFGEAARADPARVQWLNDVWRRYAADHPDVTLLDLDAHACPGGKYAATIDGVPMRTDGVHFTLAWRATAVEVARSGGPAHRARRGADTVSPPTTEPDGPAGFDRWSAAFTGLALLPLVVGGGADAHRVLGLRRELRQRRERAHGARRRQPLVLLGPFSRHGWATPARPSPT